MWGRFCKAPWRRTGASTGVWAKVSQKRHYQETAGPEGAF